MPCAPARSMATRSSHDPRAADHAGFRAQDDLVEAQFDALVRPSRPTRWDAEPVTPGLDAARPRRAPRRLGRGGGRAIEVFHAAGTGWPIPDEGVDAWNERHVVATRAPRRPAEALARYDAGRAALLGAVDTLADRGPALAGRLELGVRLPARPYPQAPGDARPVVRRSPTGRGLMPTDRSPGAGDRRRRPDHRGDRRGRVARASSGSIPRDRVVAYTAEIGGARQLFTLSLRGTGAPATQLTASEKAVSDPQWSPDGRRLAFVRDEEIWIVEADGSRLTKRGAPSRAAAASRAGRPTGIASRSCRVGAAGPRSG